MSDSPAPTLITLNHPASMIYITDLGDVAVVTIGMTSIRERQAAVIQERLRSVAEQFDGRLAISLADVSVLTSAGINALVAVSRNCEEIGGRAVVFAVKPELRRVFKDTGIDRLLTLAADCGRAVDMLKPKPVTRVKRLPAA